MSARVLAPQRTRGRGRSSDAHPPRFHSAVCHDRADVRRARPFGRCARSANQGRRVKSHATPTVIDRRRLLPLLAAAPLLAFGRTAAAQAPSPPGWPSRVVKLVVPFTPGGGIDAIGRILGARLSEMWGQQVVIENKPGAGGNIASEFVARSAPDGYTMYISAAGLAVNRYLFASINYDPLADFAPVTLICLFPNILVVPSSSQVHSVGDLLALARTNPGKVTFASPGHGSSPHMSGELFKYIAKVDLTHVPYRGASPAYADVIAGRVDWTFAVMASGLPLVRSGQLRALGVTTAARVAAAPGCQLSPRPACPGTTPRRGSLSSCRPRHQSKSSPRCTPTPSPRLPRRRSEPSSTRLASWWWAPRLNNSGRIFRPRWSGGRPSSRRPTSGSASDHPPPRERAHRSNEKWEGRTAVTRKPMTTTTLGTASFLIFAGMVHADEIRVLSTQATEEAYRELVPQFEKASGHKVTTVFTGTLDANKRLAAGETYDLLIMSLPSIEEHIKAGKVVPGSRVDLAKSGVGVGVKAGAPKPDIRTTEALKKT